MKERAARLSPVEIRPFTPEDFEVTVAMWRAVMAETYTFLQLHTEKEDRGYFQGVILKENEVWVAVAGGEVVGFLAMAADFLDRLYVAVPRQGQGVGTALLEHAKRSSPDGLRLYTHQKNVGACRFYERRGFVVFKYGVSPPPESEPDVEYRWQASAGAS